MIKQTHCSPVEELVLELHQSGVRIWLENNQLRSRAPKGAITPALRNRIQTHKTALIDFLAQTQTEMLSIQPVPRKTSDVIPLSLTQESLWLLEQIETGSTVYNEAFALRLTGNLEVDALHHALSDIVERHESLRTTFCVNAAGESGQMIHQPGGFALPQLDLTHLSETRQQDEIQALSTQAAQTPFDLVKGPLFHCQLLRLSARPTATSHVLLMVIHHLISDGWSIGLLVREILTQYAALVTGNPSPLPDLPVQYADYAIWQRSYLQEEVLKGHLDYWKHQLSGAPALLELPTDRPRPAHQTFRGHRIFFSIDAGCVQKLNTLAQHHSVTLFVVLLAAFNILLARYSRQDDILVGSPIANRHHQKLESLIGYFVNTTVFRTQLTEQQTFPELLAQVKKTTREAAEHQDVAFSSIVSAVQPVRDTSYSPLFQVLFAFQNIPTIRNLNIDVPGLEINHIALDVENSKYDIFLELYEDSNKLSGSFEYNKDLFDAATIERMAGHFRTLLNHIVVQSDQLIQQLPLLTAAEIAQLQAWNETTVDYPSDQTLVNLLEARVTQIPDHIAVSFEGETLTYQQLNARANQLAHYLCNLMNDRGEALIRPDTLVGICVERSLAMITGLLGILKSGGAYVPLDPNYPTTRLQHMLEDSQVPVLLTQQGLQERLPEYAGVTVLLDQSGIFNAQPAHNIVHQIAPCHLAYVLFTSGSTGKPKGVMIEHRNVAALMNWVQNEIDAAYFQGVLASTSINFDLSVYELFATLCCGGRIILAENVLHLADLADKDLITLINTVPSAITELQRSQAIPTSVLCINLAGEALTRNLVDTLYQQTQVEAIYNLYGPSEDTTYSTYARLPRVLSAAPTIGRPVMNTRIYLLDASYQPVPVGVPGELCIAGDGLARGYLNRPDLTAEKFIKIELFGQTERIYRTGDLARWLPDSNLEYLGRMDHQVKLRGFRIELGEIEATLLAHDAVQDTVVVLRENAGSGQQLVGYLVAEPDSHTDIQVEYVEQWQELYEKTYDETVAPADLTFNLSGWNSSYTGQPIPEADMATWVADTVADIRRLGCQRILEIGCGTGLLLSQLAPGCELYWGTDYSHQAIAQVARFKDAQTDLGHLVLAQRMADDFTDIADNQFDGVVLNSVVQYFPDVDYLLRVLTGAVRAVASGGRIYIGDVRNARLLTMYHTMVQTCQAADELSLQALDTLIRQRVLDEEELLVDPAFFYALPEHLPEIHLVEVQLKRGEYINELSQFRYQVVLHIDKTEPQSVVTPEITWQELVWQQGWDLTTVTDRLQQSLQRHPDQGLVIRHIPNRRIQAGARTLALLEQNRLPDADSLIETVAQLRTHLAEQDIGINPAALWSLAEQTPAQVFVTWSRAPDCCDMYCISRTVAPAAWAAAACPIQKTPAWHRYTNNPLLGKLHRKLVPQIRDWLTAKLPDYMIPSVFVLLDTLPLTPNGKVDRQALPAPFMVQSEAVDFIPPATDTEIALAEMWSDLLRLQQVGLQDHFFHSGGHSLLATQLASRIRQTLAVDLPITVLFDHPTLGKLAHWVDQQQRNASLPPITSQAADSPKMMSYAQQRLWFLAQLEGQSATYNMPAVLRLQGILNLTALQDTLCYLVQRHEGLRTAFPADSSQTQVTIIPPYNPLQITDLSQFNSEEQERRIAQLAYDHAHAPFDLSTGRLFRLKLIQLAEDAHVLLFNMHHIISDGWSLNLLIKEWTIGYAACSRGSTPQLPVLPIQYTDYATWQREVLTGDMLATQQTYWQTQLKDIPPLLNLPADYPRPAEPSYQGAHYHSCLDTELTQQLNQLSQQHNSTLYMTLLTAFNILLYRYTRQQDILVGSPIAGRTHHDLDHLLGLFINTLVLRTHIDSQARPGFADLLQQTRRTTLSAYAHQDLPFEHLVDLLQPERSMSHSPLFQVMFVLQNNEEVALELPELSVQITEQSFQIAKFDLTLYVTERSGQLQLDWEYATDLFKRERIERMAEHFAALLAGIVAQPRAAVLTLPFLTAAEMTQLQIWNETTTGYPADQTLTDLFEAQVRQTPGHIAVNFEGNTLSYQQLNARANRLAHHLRPQIEPDTLVGICVERSLEMIIGLLGILKAGGAYVPLDPGYPAERLTYMLADGQVTVLLTQRHLQDQLPDYAGQICCLDHPALCADQPEHNLPRIAQPHHLAYVIYTSGSTGQPKGAMIPHRALSNFIRDMQQRMALQPQEQVVALTTLSFDIAGLELYLPLICGATIRLVSRAVAGDGAALQAVLSDQKVRLIQATPATWQLLQASDWQAEQPLTLLCGGERLDPELGRYLLQQSAQLWNVYGPTETTIWSAAHHVTGQPEHPQWIGQPIANTRIYILDDQNQIVPPGVPGELCIGGSGLARGYLDRPELTAEKFIEVALFGQAERIYKTGDLARWLPDGNLEYLGRIDHQVKLRGFRIELGEIEALLSQQESVSEAVVVVHEREATKSLAAYVTAVGETIDIADLREVLKTRLPDYMVPNSITLLEALPLTPNGKIDRRALPDPDQSMVTDNTPLQTATEHEIAAVWSAVLKQDVTGAQSHFFASGGNSLLIVQVHHQLKATYPGLTMADLFHYPTIQALAAHLERLTTDQAPDLSVQSDAAQARAVQRRSQRATRRNRQKR